MNTQHRPKLSNNNEISAMERKQTKVHKHKKDTYLFGGLVNVSQKNKKK